MYFINTLKECAIIAISLVCIAYDNTILEFRKNGRSQNLHINILYTLSAIYPFLLIIVGGIIYSMYKITAIISITLGVLGIINMILFWRYVKE